MFVVCTSHHRRFNNTAHSVLFGMEINDMPKEVLLLIFENIDVQDLLDASQVCVRWRKLIKGSKSLWNNVNLNLDSDDDQLDLCVLFFRWLKLAPALNKLIVSFDVLAFMEPVLLHFDKRAPTEFIPPKIISIRRLCITKSITHFFNGMSSLRNLFSFIRKKWGVKLECECETVDVSKSIYDPKESLNNLKVLEIGMILKSTVLDIENTKLRIEDKELEFFTELMAMETEKSEMDTNRMQLLPFLAWNKISPDILDKVNFDKEEIELKNIDVNIIELEGAVNKLRNSGKLDKKMKGIQLVMDMCRMDIEDSKKEINELKTLKLQIEKTVMKKKVA